MRLSLLFEVYPGERYPCDTAEVVDQRGTHSQKLLHPHGTKYAYVKDMFSVEVKDLGVLREGWTAGNAPCRGQAVLIGDVAQGSPQGIAQNVTHTLHVDTS
jgi:hypothetical protein